MNVKYWMTAALLAAALPAGAATVSETTSGEFSSIWTAPTEIESGAKTVTGSGRSGDTDVFALSGYDGTMTGVTIDFSGSAYYRSGWYGAGGTVLYSTEPFEWAWDGTTADTFSVGYMSSSWFTFGTIEDSVTIPLSLSSADTLYLAIVYSYGPALDYTIGVSVDPDAGPSIPAVPLPASAGLLLTGAGALGVIARRRKAKRA